MLIIFCPLFFRHVFEPLQVVYLCKHVLLCQKHTFLVQSIHSEATRFFDCLVNDPVWFSYDGGHKKLPLVLLQPFEPPWAGLPGRPGHKLCCKALLGCRNSNRALVSPQNWTKGEGERLLCLDGKIQDFQAGTLTTKYGSHWAISLLCLYFSGLKAEGMTSSSLWTSNFHEEV